MKQEALCGPLTNPTCPLPLTLPVFKILTKFSKALRPFLDFVRWIKYRRQVRTLLKRQIFELRIGHQPSSSSMPTVNASSRRLGSYSAEPVDVSSLSASIQKTTPSPA